jgi:hypothetical protein
MFSEWSQVSGGVRGVRGVLGVLGFPVCRTFTSNQPEFLPRRVAQVDLGGEKNLLFEID